MMKNLIKTTLILLALILPSLASAHDFEVDGIYYNINGNEATVTCKGSYSNEYSGSVVIPTTVTYNGVTYSVTSIGGWAFSSCTGLTSINIPYSVTSIGGWAFSSCTGLTSIDIPNSVTTIGISAFSSCTGLTSIDIPNSVTTIGISAFSSCTGLTSIDIPNSLTSIGKSAFSGCTGLTSIVVASNNPCYDSRNNCNAIIEIASNSLIAGCKNTIIPNSVTSIGSSAFTGCTGLTSIDIPNSVTSIGDEAFYGCTGLMGIDIGNSVTTIGGGAFNYCPNVTSINCFAVNPPTCINVIVDGLAVLSCHVFGNYSATLHVPKASLATYFTTPEWSYFENIVGDALAPTGISISKDSMEIQLGEQFELTATVTPANASIQEVTWYSTDTSVATVENGTITTVGVGECDIVASCFGIPAICHVSVFNRIMLDQHEVMLQPNHMLTLTPTVTVMPNRLTVISSDPTVAAAKVMNGKVQVVGVAEGTTTITVGAADGTAIPATCLVTVYTEPGDVNMDGFTDIDDVTAMVSYVLGDGVDVFKADNANLNGDNAIDIDDITALISQILGN